MIGPHENFEAGSKPVPRTFGMNGCPNCRLFKQCGGHPLPFIFEVGCANFAAGDQPVDTDDMNPHFDDRFWELWNDVGGLFDYTVGPLKALQPEGLPTYMPLFQHRYLKRERLLDAPIVALPLFEVIGRRRDGSYAPKFATASELRRKYKLRHDTRILLVGVDDDGPLELFWEEHTVPGVCESLGDLGIIGVTVPNFSYFTCVPRFQIMRNRKRIYLAAERLSKAGIPVSLHINANTIGDWNAAYEFLVEHPEVTVVTMEFQTGTRANGDVGDEAFAALLALQARLGRPLHPIFVGAARYYKEARNNFKTFTVIDSQPFMQAKSRCILTTDGAGRYFWKHHPTAKKAPLDDLIETNLVYYEGKLKAETKSADKPEFVDPLQELFSL